MLDRVLSPVLVGRQQELSQLDAPLRSGTRPASWISRGPLALVLAVLASASVIALASH